MKLYLIVFIGEWVFLVMKAVYLCFNMLWVRVITAVLMLILFTIASIKKRIELLERNDKGEDL